MLFMNLKISKLYSRLLVTCNSNFAGSSNSNLLYALKINSLVRYIVSNIFVIDYFIQKI